MKIETSSKWWIFNGILEHVPNEVRDRSLENPVVYEVIRIKEGKAVFLKAHLKRLKQSLQIMLKGKKMPDWIDDIELHFFDLIMAEHIKNQNIRIIIWNIGHPACSWCMFPIKSTYPDESTYNTGVDTAILNSERVSPNAKIYHNTLIQTVQAMREETGIFEVLLSDRRGCLTEGSRSNLFFTKGNTVYSAPEADILHGITREKLKRVLESESIELRTECIPIESIDTFDGVFITGTSIHVLPVRSIGSRQYNSASNTLIRKIRNAFETSIEKDSEYV